MVERGIELVAIAGADQLPVLAVAIDLVDAASRSKHAFHEAVAVGHPRQQVVFAPGVRHARAAVVHDLGAVAHNHVQRLAVGRKQHGMRAVFAAAGNLAQQFHVVQAVIVPAGPYAVQATFIMLSMVDHDVEAIERPEETMCLANRGIDFLDLGGLGLTAERRRRDAVQGAVLVRNDEPALGVDAHVDPRAFLVLGHRVEQFGLEVLMHIELFRRRRGYLLDGCVRGRRLGFFASWQRRAKNGACRSNACQQDYRQINSSEDSHGGFHRCRVRFAAEHGWDHLNIQEARPIPDFGFLIRVGCLLRKDNRQNTPDE